jgi:hypothetical protein
MIGCDGTPGASGAGTAGSKNRGTGPTTVPNMTMKSCPATTQDIDQLSISTVNTTFMWSIGLRTTGVPN